MCSNCGKNFSYAFSMNLRDLFNKANSYDKASAPAAVGRYKEILDVLRKNGGCNSCTRLIEEKIRTTF